MLFYNKFLVYICIPYTIHICIQYNTMHCFFIIHINSEQYKLYIYIAESKYLLYKTQNTKSKCTRSMKNKIMN